MSGENHNSKRYMHPNVHCSTIYNSQVMEATKCPLTDEWLKKMWHIYTMEYYSALKKKETVTHATTWMNPDIVSEISQSQKDKYYMSLLL